MTACAWGSSASAALDLASARTSVHHAQPPELPGLLTLLLNTSPCAGHPSTLLLEEVLASMLAHAPGVAGCRLLVLADGVKLHSTTRLKSGQVTPQLAAAYACFLARVQHLCACKGGPLHGAELVALEERHGCAHALRRGLARVTTPYVLVLQHDRALCAPVDVASLVAALEEAPGDVHSVGLTTSTTVDYQHRIASRGGLPAQLFAPRRVAGLSLVPLAAFLDSTHVARVEWYKSRVFGRSRSVALPRGCFLEDTFGQWQLREVRERGAEALRSHGVYLYEQTEPCVLHLDGHDSLSSSPEWRKWRHAERHTPQAQLELLESTGALPQHVPRLKGFFDPPPGMPPRAPQLQAADACVDVDPPAALRCGGASVVS